MLKLCIEVCLCVLDALIVVCETSMLNDNGTRYISEYYYTGRNSANSNRDCRGWPHTADQSRLTITADRDIFIWIVAISLYSNSCFFIRLCGFP